jgi:hypothetical protein
VTRFSPNVISAYELYTATTSSMTMRDAKTADKLNTTWLEAQGTVPKASAKKEIDLAEAEDLCERFKTTLSRPDVKVHFVGAW